MKDSQFIGNDLYFRRVCRHIDILTINQHLGSRDKLISRTKYLRNFGNCLRTICHRPNRLCTANFEYFFNAAQIGCDKNCGIDAPVAQRGGTHHDFFATRDLCGNRRHQNRRRVSGLSSGNVESYFFDRTKLTPYFDAVFSFNDAFFSS